MKGMTLEAVAKACDGIYHGSDGDKNKRSFSYYNRQQADTATGNVYCD